MSRLRVDFHCRVIFICLYTHVNFTCVNKIEERYELSRLNVKLTTFMFRFHFYVYGARPFIVLHCLKRG